MKGNRVAANIKVNIEVIQQNAQRQISRLAKSTRVAEKEFNTLSVSVNRASGALSSFFGNVGANAFSSLTSGLKGLAVSSFETTKELETLSTQFEVLTGSSLLAEDAIKNLQEFAASTPFQFADLARSTQRLISFGFTADEAQESLKDLGDVAAASGANIGELSLIFGQVQAAGKLTGERLLQLQERAIPIGPAIAKTLGVAESAVADLVRQGKIDFKTFETAFKSLNDTGEFAFEGMIKRSQTLEGRISTLNDNFKLLQADLGSALAPAIKSVVSGLTSFIQLIRDNTALQALIVGLGTAAAGFTLVAAKAALSTVSFGAVATAASAAWVAITGPVGLVIGGLSLVAAAIFAVFKNLDNLKRLSNEYLGTTFKITDQTKEQAAELDKLKQKAKEAADAVKAQNAAAEDRAKVEVAAAKAAKDAEKIKRENLKKTAELEKKIAEDKLAAELAVTQAQNLEFSTRFEQERLFNESRLLSVRDYFSEEEKLRAEARISTIEDERVKQTEIDKLLAEGITRRSLKQIKTAQETADAIIAEDNRYFENQRKLKDAEKKNDEMRAANRRSSLNTISTLQRSNSKELAFVGKAAGITQIAIDTPVAVSKALSAFPPPFNFIAAAAVGAAMATQAAQIASVNVGGFESGGIVPGSSFAGDRLTANVNSGEMILNRQQQAELFRMANNGGAQQSASQPIVINTTLELDNEVIGRATSNWVANGGQLGEVQ